MRKILMAVGARPNFMKAAPLMHALQKKEFLSPLLLHTGQHYDGEMSGIFFKDLELRKPDFYLNVGSNTHAVQTARIMMAFEKVLYREKPDLVVVFGDVNSTLACALTAKKLLVPVAHVEAGLRSFDETMPEEINRKLTDSISDLLFTPSEEANKNLEREGIARERIFFVGNIMIDSLKNILGQIDRDYERQTLDRFALKRGEYILVTLHRPANVDLKERLKAIMNKISSVSRYIKILWPLHPRTQENIKKMKISLPNKPEFFFSQPLGYKEFISLEKMARLVVTDSGGIQEESTFLNVPCLTLRPHTERPITLSQGTNRLVNLDNLGKNIQNILDANQSTYFTHDIPPPLWDGNTAGRIGKILEKNW